ncbi:MAG: hypothetical protein U0525_02155 [Patescibacteria group bacterium]
MIENQNTQQTVQEIPNVSTTPQTQSPTKSNKVSQYIAGLIIAYLVTSVVGTILISSSIYAKPPLEFIVSTVLLTIVGFIVAFVYYFRKGKRPFAWGLITPVLLPFLLFGLCMGMLS